MHIGMIGLGRMGANMVRRLQRGGHHCVVFDHVPDAVKVMVNEQAMGAGSLADLVTRLEKPAVIWMMIPAASVAQLVDDLLPHLDPGEILVDGGNSRYEDDIRIAGELAEKGIHYIDCGTSGGVKGLERGYCLMIGGPPEAVAYLDPVFRTLAPGTNHSPDGLDPEGPADKAREGFLHCGPIGAGHFVKMVHNGIEYGLMAAYAEGMNVLANANAGRAALPVDAETTPLRNPEAFQFDFDLYAIAELWRRGSVISSFLLDLTTVALSRDATLAAFRGRVSDSGEGRWMLNAAIDEAVPVPVLSAALFSRFNSRGNASFADKLVSAMRFEFGEHVEKPERP